MLQTWKIHLLLKICWIWNVFVFCIFIRKGFPNLVIIQWFIFSRFGFLHTFFCLSSGQKTDWLFCSVKMNFSKNFKRFHSDKVKSIPLILNSYNAPWRHHNLTAHQLFYGKQLIKYVHLSFCTLRLNSEIFSFLVFQ